MPRGEGISPQILRGLEQIGEFDLGIAGDAGNGRFAHRIGLRKPVNHLLAKAGFIIQDIMRNTEARRNLTRVAVSYTHLDVYKRQR